MCWFIRLFIRKNSSPFRSGRIDVEAVAGVMSRIIKGDDHRPALRLLDRVTRIAPFNYAKHEAEELALAVVVDLHGFRVLALGRRFLEEAVRVVLMRHPAGKQGVAAGDAHDRDIRHEPKQAEAPESGCKAI